MRFVILTFATGLAVASAVFLFSSGCPRRSFTIAGSMVTAGSLACEQENIERAQAENPTQAILNGGI